MTCKEALPRHYSADLDSSRRQDSRGHVHRRGFDHTALFYHSEREYVDWLVQFISEGLDQQQPVWLAVPGDRLASLRSALGDAATDVTMADITEFGRNPARIIAQQLAFVERHPRPACAHHHRTGLGRSKCARIPRVHAARGTVQHRFRRRRHHRSLPLRRVVPGRKRA